MGVVTMGGVRLLAVLSLFSVPGGFTKLDRFTFAVRSQEREARERTSVRERAYGGAVALPVGGD